MAEMISIHLSDDEVCEAFVARASTAKVECSGVLMFMDAIGLRPQIGAMADRIASWGYVVLAPNTYHQFGTAEQTSPTAALTDPQAREEFISAGRPRMHGLFAEGNRRHLLDDLRAYADQLHALDGVSSGPIGVVGYCMGARLAILAAGELGDGVAAAAGFHGGRMVTDDHLSPHLALPRARAEFWFGHADNDGSNPPDQQSALDQALTSAGLVHGAAVYEGAQHGFSMADTAMYNEQAAERHFTDFEQLLARTLPPAGS